MFVKASLYLWGQRVLACEGSDDVALFKSTWSLWPSNPGG
jgi:hypothetical protein